MDKEKFYVLKDDYGFVKRAGSSLEYTDSVQDSVHIVSPSIANNVASRIIEDGLSSTIKVFQVVVTDDGLIRSEV